MKRIFHKLGSKKGETLVEILVAVVIIALAAGLFAALYSASMNINVEARNQDEAFYKAVDDLESMLDGVASNSNGKVHYEATDDEKGEANVDESKADVNVDIVTQDGMTVYKAAEGGSTEGGSTEGGTP